MHDPLAQSLFVEHVFLLGHRGHLVPPQSVSVSSKFWTSSSHVGAKNEFYKLCVNFNFRICNWIGSLETLIFMSVKYCPILFLMSMCRFSFLFMLYSLMLHSEYL